MHGGFVHGILIKLELRTTHPKDGARVAFRWSLARVLSTSNDFACGFTARVKMLSTEETMSCKTTTFALPPGLTRA